MKRTIFTILICGIVILSITGCGKSKEDEKKQPVDNTKFDFYISKEESHNDIKFNDYLTFNDRKYYLAGNIKEFYVIDGESMILKSYITNFNHILDNPSIDKITSELELKDTLRDGGTKIYKSEDKDITIVVCNNLEGNDDIFIGDYSMSFDSESMCK